LIPGKNVTSRGCKISSYYNWMNLIVMIISDLSKEIILYI